MSADVASPARSSSDLRREAGDSSAGLAAPGCGRQAKGQRSDVVEGISATEAARVRTGNADGPVRPVLRAAVRAGIRHDGRQRACGACCCRRSKGAAVTAVKIEGVLHEFSPIQGVVEDATDIILNLKQIPLKMHTDQPKTLTLRATKPGEVRARDIEADADVEILEPDAHIATVSDGGQLEMELRIKRGRGYVVGRQELRRGPGHRLDSDRLGALAGQEGQLRRRGGAHRPDDRLRQADARGVDQRRRDAARRRVARGQADSRPLHDLRRPRRGGRPAARGRRRPAASASVNEHLDKSVEELELSVRSYNCLKNANIRTLRELVQKTEARC